MDEAPPRFSPLFALKIWRGMGVVALLYGTWGTYEVLSAEPARYNSLLGREIGGIQPGEVFIGLVIMAAGLALAVWAHRTIAKHRAREEAPPSEEGGAV